MRDNERRDYGFRPRSVRSRGLNDAKAHLSHAVERLTFRRDVWQGFGMKAALLPDRGVVKVVGDDASRLLNGLVTADMEKITPARPAFAALLTPQGKIIADFMLAEAGPGEGFFFD